MSDVTPRKNWETDPKFKAKEYAEPHLSATAKVENTEPSQISPKMVWLTIDFNA